MALPQYIFGAGTGINSPEELARARAYAEALLGPQRPAQNVGEGLAVLGQAIRGRREMNAVNKASAAGDASASSAIAQALGGGGSFPPAPGGGSPVSAALGGNVGAAPASASSGPPSDVEKYIREYASSIGVDPDVAAKVAGGEGGFKDPFRHGEGPAPKSQAAGLGSTENSYGPLQLYISGNNAGLGDRALAAGIDPRKDWQGGVRFALDEAKRKGWGQWYGAKAQGITGMMGIGNSPVAAAPAPQQVASLDPAVGMPPAPSPVAAALQLPAQGPIPQDRPNIAAALNGAPQMPNPGPGDPAATTPAGQRVLGQMMSPLPMGGQSMQMQPMAGAATAPAPAAPQAAQAQPNLDQIPVEAGGNAGAVQPGGLPSVQELMQAAQNPWLKPEQRQLINGLLAQKMKQSDPAEMLEMEKNRLDMEKTRIETEHLRNPQMSPAEKARLDLDTQKFDADQKKLMELSPGTTVFDPATRAPVYSAPKDAAKPAGIAEYEYAKEQGFPGTFQDWEASKKGGMSFQTNPDGTVTFQQGGNIKPMTEAQSKDTTFATRAAGALPLVDKYGDALTSFGGNLAANGGALGNYMKSPEYQQAEQAGKEFLQAILRKDTGAAITAGETTEYGSVYLPRPGDSPELLAQKKQSRTRALEAMKAGMTPQAILAQEKATAASTPPPAGGPPQAGAVEDGYRFKGGDPADQNNWEPAQ